MSPSKISEAIGIVRETGGAIPPPLVITSNPANVRRGGAGLSGQDIRRTPNLLQTCDFGCFGAGAPNGWRQFAERNPVDYKRSSSPSIGGAAAHLGLERALSAPPQ